MGTDNLTAEQMKQKIDSLPLPMGGTDGGLALNEAFNTLFNGKGNPDVYQNAIFLSDGNGGDPLTAAENFHRNGIHLTSVALGAANKDLMRHLTGMNRNPPLTYKNHFFEHHDANMLAKAAKDMTMKSFLARVIKLQLQMQQNPQVTTFHKHNLPK